MTSKIKKILKFLFFGNKKRVGSSNKSNRDVWLTKTIRRIPEGARILDAGAGELRNRDLCAHLNYMSQDFGDYKGNDPNGPGLGSTKIWDTSKVDLICDIVNIPEPDSSFDAVLCSEVFEHLPDPILALKELVRLLKPGGKLILTAPFCSITHQAPYFYHTGFSRFFYEYWCAELGLNIIELGSNGNYFEYLAQELNRLSTISLKYSKLKFGFFEKLSRALLMRFLDRSSFQDSTSHELLCYGFHLLAEKNIQ